MTIEEAVKLLTPAISVSNWKLDGCFCTFGTKTIYFCFEGKLYVVPYSELLESFLFQHMKYSVDLQNKIQEVETKPCNVRKLMKLLTTEKCKEISRELGILPISQEILDNSIKVSTIGGFVSICSDGTVRHYFAARYKYDLTKMVDIFLGEFNFKNNVLTFITDEGKQYFTKYANEGGGVIAYLISRGYKKNPYIGVPCSEGDYPYQKKLREQWDSIGNSDDLC